MTLLEWQDRFGTEDACREYLFRQRWLDGFRCPACEGREYWTIQRSGRPAPLYHIFRTSLDRKK